MANKKAPSLKVLLAQIRAASDSDLAARGELDKQTDAMIASGHMPRPLNLEIDSAVFVRQEIHRELSNRNIDPVWDDQPEGESANPRRQRSRSDRDVRPGPSG